ncbi:MAG: pyridoxine 5'-phosphate synthase [Candidatus Fluviicola riflensis]|nr:MAG: pyridoxine 5'-phosphate synthase [Candidatus Fluviicola riflensis]OGS79091.1 MAG: pyridoxine 5'-phosphate synthase [Candidatus Fluviicola riflensis]OGS86114.1 MAG: pyridoxine 5'-phosphate synthase [Fluviicola sp. RIFCSPHIGHO2_12_FULL_43_24]OGS86523.1 MAG: pyridoxine 5'-phosphate synthase [Fluviicola sp. RIFCSPHIGHO2_01_FULL_43_53]
MTKLSVNINKIATIRNARGGNTPNVVQMAMDCERFGAEGITVHPRPDERHITGKDVIDLAKVVTTEFNIEGYPDQRYMDMIERIRPVQATLVPDPPHVLTSNAGWDTKANELQLKELVNQLHKWGVRTSIFVDTNLQNIEYAAKTGVNRVEFYTGPYAEQFSAGKEKAVEPYIIAAKRALELGLELNAGHDLNQENLRFFKQSIPELAEVSIGHALISDALYLGLENTIQRYIYLLR